MYVPRLAVQAYINLFCTMIIKQTKLQWTYPSLMIQGCMHINRQNSSEHVHALLYKHTKTDKTQVNMSKPCCTSIPNQTELKWNMPKPYGTKIHAPLQTKLQWTYPSLAVQAYQNRQNCSEHAQALLYKHTKNRQNSSEHAQALLYKHTKNRQNSSETCPSLAVQAYQKQDKTPVNMPKPCYTSIPKTDKTPVNMPKPCCTSIPKQTELKWTCLSLTVQRYMQLHRQNSSEHVHALLYKHTKTDKTPVNMPKPCCTSSIPKQTDLKRTYPSLTVQGHKVMHLNRQNSSETYRRLAA